MRHLFTALALSTLLVTSTSTVSYAQVYANSQSNGSNGLCIGCGTLNAGRAVDGDLSNYATMQLTVSVLGAHTWKHFSFPVQGNSGSYLGVILESNSGGLLDLVLVGGVSITSYMSGVSNDDTRSAGGISLRLLPGSSTRFLFEYRTAHDFNQVRMIFNAGILGAANQLRIYAAYHHSVALPVELIDFQATAMHNTVRLDWETATETNNAYFSLQRSTDGITFETIGQVEGQGTTSQGQAYSWHDDAPLAGLSYYRLLQTDMDGSTETYPARAVQLNPDEKGIGMYPNPVSGRSGQPLTISSTKEFNRAEIFNMSGQLVHSENFYPLTQAKLSVPADLCPGLYTVRVWQNNTPEIVKLVVE